ncbi:hypothetical protein [Jatrophihabitans lederbergiae]|uniref:Acyl-CoA dehydrogenase n=1 Tax=Jatrophihabitans lederbergiae TaxID=3075547 RepID=A0ABU2J8P0_9ACTN|nr:hypothetical protein [Jatrophihabitans sp. DSM 44399]MDT0261355.1 hypothetical protein [Jatrophihabitans sp. DSM 44399]
MKFDDLPPLRINDLGPGWEETERALAAADWYFGADGGFDLGREYAESVVDIADQLQGAVAANLLGNFGPGSSPRRRARMRLDV